MNLNGYRSINPICTKTGCLATIGTMYIAGKTLITITPNGSRSYNIPIGNSSLQRGQFYFIATLNTTGGQYVSQSNDPKTLTS